jgi:hypothetical protein
MSSDPVRKFHLSDAAILIAATAVGLAIVRYYLATPNELIPIKGPKGIITMTPSFVDRGRRGAATIAAILLSAWSIALAGIGLRSPRPPFKELMQRPGMGACLLTSLFVVTFLLGIHLWHLIHDHLMTDHRDNAVGVMKFVISGRLDQFANGLLPDIALLGGAQVIGAWIGVAVKYGWRAPTDWIEQSGRILGVAWILVAIASFP